MRRKADGEPMKIGVGTQILDVANRVDVPLDEVASKPPVGPQRTFEVEATATRQRAECRDANGFGPDIRVNLARLRKNDGQAHAIDRDAVAEFYVAPIVEDRQRQPAELRSARHAGDADRVLNDSRKHLRETS